MSERSFRLRLSCRYEEPDNSIADLAVEVLSDAGWERLDVNAHTPGFLLFAYTILSCQHRYLRTNCAEKGFRLASASGSIDLVASEDWFVRMMHVRFDLHLGSGTPARADLDFIVGRMKECPVSKNLKTVPDSRTEIFIA